MLERLACQRFAALGPSPSDAQAGFRFSGWRAVAQRGADRQVWPVRRFCDPGRHRRPQVAAGAACSDGGGQRSSPPSAWGLELIARQLFALSSAGRQLGEIEALNSRGRPPPPARPLPTLPLSTGAVPRWGCPPACVQLRYDQVQVSPPFSVRAPLRPSTITTPLISGKRHGGGWGR